MAEISVVIPIYNGEEYLKESMDSILNQSFKDFEVILVCEAGTNDKSLKIVHHYKEEYKNVQVIENEERLGISESLNVGIKKSTGKYIARMDADDIAGYRRLEVQKMYMDMYDKIGVCGTKYKVLNSPRWIVDYHTDPQQIKSDLLFFVPLRHPTIMIRSDVIYENNLFYDSTLPGVEDYDYFIRASQVTDLTNICDAELFTYRRTASATSAVYKERDEIIRKELMRRQFKNNLNLEFTDEVLDVLDVVDGVSKDNPNEYNVILKDLEKELDNIVATNKELEVYNASCLMETMNQCWSRIKYSMDICTNGNIPDNARKQWRDSKYYSRWMD